MRLGVEHGEILDKMTALMDACEKSAVNAKEMEEVSMNVSTV